MIFAAGKTHTVFGADWDRVFSQFESRMKKQMTFIQNIESDFNTAGIIPRAIHHVFKELANPEHNSKKFVVYCGFMQIYNEKIFDLLQVLQIYNQMCLKSWLFFQGK